jgi:hypothetical protein
VPTCSCWVLLAIWRMLQYGVTNYAVMVLTGLIASTITFMALGSRRNYLRHAVREVTG